MRGSMVFVVVASAAVLGTVGGSPAGAGACAGADRTASSATIAQTRAALRCLIDAARADRSLAGLKADARLQSAAQKFARALDPGKPLTHAGRGGSTPLDRIADSGYARGASGFTAAETLGRSHGSLSTPAARVKAWLADAGTRRLLLGARYRDVGIGVVSRGDVTTFVVEIAARATASRSAR
ncbi:MAG TPA: CAP domain-containing protein [Baekduia sp.]|nr:CAP domain-containing protein [Baekduia sp.]